MVETLVSIVTGVVTIASILANFTETTKDDKAVSDFRVKLEKFVNLLAINLKG